MKDVVLSKGFIVALALTFACSLAGSALAKLPYLQIAGAMVLSLLLGMLAQFLRRAVAFGSRGIALISNKFLRAGIILLGFRLNLLVLADSGVRTIALACVIVAGTIALTYMLERKADVDKHLAILTASGCGICGAAAVMGISSQLPKGKTEAEQARQAENKVVAVAIVAILGTVFTLIDVTIKPLLGLTAEQFGVFTGGSLHEIAHAVAAGSAMGSAGLDAAIITKLSRVLLLAPAAMIIGVWYRRGSAAAESGEAAGRVPIPWFMVGFVAASVVGTFVPLGADVIAGLVNVSYLLLGMAMAALGMTVNFRVLFERGRNAFGVALGTSAALMLFALICARIFF
ncbi:MAG: YeiH family protein [Eggerthellaceae bacterium]|jgi:uncharacterized integral membrane protein (TIGR00698 family)